MKSLISGLNITRYQGLLKTKLDDPERQEIQALLQEEELWLAQAAYAEIALTIGTDAEGE
jgi:hypothetical protein